MNATRTDAALVGRKVWLRWEAGRNVLATIVRLDSTYPLTAYTVTWTVADNPTEPMPPGGAGWYSVAHCSQVLSVA